MNASEYFSKMRGMANPPSVVGAALIAVIGGPKVHSLGFLSPLVPARAGAVVVLLVALIVNNPAKSRTYPEYWW